MNTVPDDLLKLLVKITNLKELVSYSLFFQNIEQPKRCNNLIEAIMTDNWPQINSHGELIPVGLKCYRLVATEKTIIEYKKYIENLNINSNYGPPLSLLHQHVITTFTKDRYLDNCGRVFKNAEDPITIPLVIHTPVVYHNGMWNKLRYEPLVGSVCSIDRGNGEFDSSVVTDVILTKGKEKRVKEFVISRITFINSTTVVYDSKQPKILCRFYPSVWGWFPVGNNGRLVFDRYTFDGK